MSFSGRKPQVICFIPMSPGREKIEFLNSAEICFYMLAYGVLFSSMFAMLSFKTPAPRHPLLDKGD